LAKQLLGGKPGARGPDKFIIPNFAGEQQRVYSHGQADILVIKFFWKNNNYCGLK
jgi:hypothetical protein